MTSQIASARTRQTPYTAPQLAWRWFLSLVIVAAAGFITFCAGIVSLIVTTGCFMGCSHPNRGAGFLFQLAAAGVFGGGIAFNGAWWPQQRRTCLRGGAAAAVLVLVVLTFIAARMLRSSY